jgi:hypothetical protein
VETFNAEGQPGESFYGIHLDNEPHQLLGFDGPWREELLRQFIELNDRIMADLRARGSELVYGIDIPFWFDEDRDADGRPTCDVTYRGVRQNAARHLIDIVDNIGIMAYRNFAGGADGIIRHAEDEVAYAASRGKKAYVGVETFSYRPTCVWFVYGPSETAWRAGPPGLGDVGLSAWGAWKVRTAAAGGVRLVGVARPEQACGGPEPREVLTGLYARVGTATGVDVAALAAATRGPARSCQLRSGGAVRVARGRAGGRRQDCARLRSCPPKRPSPGRTKRRCGRPWARWRRTSRTALRSRAWPSITTRRTGIWRTPKRDETPANMY